MTTPDVKAHLAHNRETGDCTAISSGAVVFNGTLDECAFYFFGYVIISRENDDQAMPYGYR